MKILNKRQAIILIVLNSVAVIMAAILIFGGILQRTSQPAGGSPPAEWDVHRAPRASLNEHIVWETNLGGSGDETATRCRTTMILPAAAMSAALWSRSTRRARCKR